MKFTNAVFLSKFDNHFIRFFNRVINNCSINCCLPPSTKLRLNGMGIVIGRKVKIGNNVGIDVNTVICGYVGHSPIIEDNVEIGSGCSLFGKIVIGKNSVIHAGSIIDYDVPANSYVRPKISNNQIQKKKEVGIQ